MAVIKLIHSRLMLAVLLCLLHGTQLVVEGKELTCDYGMLTSFVAPCDGELDLGDTARITCDAPQVDGAPRRESEEGEPLWSPTDVWSSAGSFCSVPFSSPMNECFAREKWGERVAPRLSQPSKQSLLIELPKERAKTFGTIVDIYGKCEGPTPGAFLFFHFQLVPVNPTPVTKTVHNCEGGNGARPSQECILRLYRDASVALTCPERAKTTPEDVVGPKLTGHYCKHPFKGKSDPCTETEKWASQDVTVTSSAARGWHTFNAGGLVLTTEPVKAYGRCIVRATREALFFVILIMPERLKTPPSVFHPKQVQCHPSDAPHAEDPCTIELWKGDVSRVNCNAISHYSPPTVDVADGHYCDQPFKDLTSPCPTSRRWDDVIKPEIYTLNGFFTIRHRDLSDLDTPIIAYGRCTNEDATEGLFFSIYFYTELGGKYRDWSSPKAPPRKPPQLLKQRGSELNEGDDLRFGTMDSAGRPSFVIRGAGGAWMMVAVLMGIAHVVLVTVLPLGSSSLS